MITTMLCEDFKRARTFEVCFCFEKEIFDLISEGKKHKASVFFLFFRIIIITQIIDTSKSNSPWRPTQKAKATTKNTTKDPTFLKPRLTKKSRKTTGARAFLFSFFPAVKCKRAIPYFLHSLSNSLLLSLSLTSPFSSRREYHMRKNMNDGAGDAVYRNLAYKAVCNCMPVCKEGCMNPYWMWTKK